jgi:hypothetical protein
MSDAVVVGHSSRYVASVWLQLHSDSGSGEGLMTIDPAFIKP